MAVTTEQVAELYVAYFNRAPDTAGLDYWVNTGLAIEEISSSFYVQDETKTNYPDTMTNSIFVNTIYENVFNRDADPDGLVYWENELTNETITRPNMILAITKGAKTTDKTILDNKTEVGLYSANAGVNDVDKATDVMKDVNETQESVDTAKAVADNYATLILTTQQDKIVGTTKDDTITGLISGTGSTYTAGDTIDGGDGDDTFRLQVTNKVSDVSAQITNVETIEIFGSASVGTISGFNWSGVENYKFSGDNNQTVANIKDAISSVTIDKAKANPVTATVDFLNKDVVDTDNDTLDVTLSNSKTNVNLSTLVDGKASDLYEELKIHSIDNSKTASLTINDASDVVKVTIDGNSDMNITLTSAKDNELLDASKLTGKLTYLSNSTSEEVINGGSNDDTIQGGGQAYATISGGEGDDNLTSQSTGSILMGGAGRDTITTAEGINHIKYDNLSVESGLTSKTADFVSLTPDSDKLSFRGLDEGTVENFYHTETPDTNVTDVESAVKEANNGILKNKMYVEYNSSLMTTDAGATAILVIDSDSDGKADGAIELNSSIIYSDIGIYQ